MPWAFTEMGVAMLSSVLRSSKAIEINRNIMRAFVMMRGQLMTSSLVIAALSAKPQPPRKVIVGFEGFGKKNKETDE